MDIAGLIDHSLLKPDHTEKDLESHIARCIEFGVHAICVNPFWVSRTSALSAGKVVVCSVVSFPFGLDKKEQKLLQSLKALEDGARELDIVMNLSAFKSGLVSYVEEELKLIAKNTEGFVRKVIIETAYLSEEEKRRAVEIVLSTGMEFVKTSTGFAPQGATEEDVSLLKSLSRGVLKVKASGGIKTREQALNFLKLGADRIGTSHTFEILK